MKKFFKIVVWALVIAAVLGTFVYLFINSRKKPVTYEIVSPSTATIERTTVLNGKIEPRDEIEIKPQISGIIAEINVEPGDVVKEGDVIARIKVIPEESQLSSAQSRVQNATQNLALARSKYERTKQLYDKKFVSREEYEESENAYSTAKIELESAEDALSIVRDGVSSTNAQQSNTLIRATITGLILEVPVKVGSSVIQANTFNDGTTIAKVADMTDLIFKGKIDETEVGLLEEGMPVKITVGAVPDLNINALIEKIAPIATEDNGTNTFEVKAALAADSLTVALRAGYSANASAILERAEDVLSVPERVVEFVGDSSYVYCLADTLAKEQKFDRVAIKTGVSNGVQIQVVEGLDMSARVRGFEQK